MKAGESKKHKQAEAWLKRRKAIRERWSHLIGEFPPNCAGRARRFRLRTATRDMRGPGQPGSRAGLHNPFEMDRAAAPPVLRFAFEGFSFVRRAFLLFYRRSNSTTEPRKAL